MDNFRANRQNIRAADAEKAKQEQAENTEFMNDFRVRRDSLRWQEKARQEAASEMQTAFDGSRRKIRGYTGGTKSGELLQGGTFNSLFNTRKDLTPRNSDTFNEFFHPTGKKSATKSGSTTNTRIREGGPKPEESLLKEIRDGINSLAAN